MSELSVSKVVKLAHKMKPVMTKHGAYVDESTVNDLIAELEKVRR